MGRLVTGLLFFGSFYVCLWKWVDVSLIYHGIGDIRDFPVFRWGWDFFHEFLAFPGGVTEYISALLAQSLFDPRWGALILTLQAGLITLCVGAYLRAMGVAPLLVRLMSFAPALLLLALYARYAHFSAPITRLAVALALLWLSLCLFSLPVRLRLGILVVLSALLYSVADGALLVFALLSTILELRRRGPWAMVLVPLLLGGLVPYLEGVVIFGLAPSEAWEKLLPFTLNRAFQAVRGATLLSALYLFLPAVAFAALLWDAFSRRSPRLAAVAKPGQSGPASSGRLDAARSASRAKSPYSVARSWLPRSEGSFRSISGRLAVETVCLLCSVIAVVCWSQDAKFKSVLAVDYHACRRMWPEALAAAAGNPTNTYVMCAVAQASHHTGKLMRELPSLHRPGDLLLFEQGHRAHWKRSDLYFDLGYVNMALHHLSEAVEFCGERPILLQRLALVNLALGNINTAKLYLNALTRTPFHARWARDYLRRAESDQSLARDPEVRRLRSLMVRRDSVLRLSLDEELLLLLEANPQNRMAFEYLMTYYLLTKNLAGFGKNLYRLDDFPGSSLSTPWEEAATLAIKQSAQQSPLRARRPSPEVQRRLALFLKALEGCGGDSELARARLQKDYGNTYFYYYYLHP